MEFENLLIQIAEILHKSIDEYKQEIVRQSKYSDLTLSQQFYLEAIFQLGKPTLSELAQHLKISKASATTGVQKLIGKGLAIKNQSERDQRVFHVLLTDDGNKLMAAEIQAISDFTDKLENSLSDQEKKQLIRIFKKIIANYKG